MPIKQITEDIFDSVKKQESLKLKTKGQSVTFRIVKNSYYYEGLHFDKDEQGKYKVVHCPRIETNEYCELCDLFFKLKKDGEENKDLKAVVNVFYMILDRSDSSLKILQVTAGVKRKIDQYLITWKQANKTALDFDLKLTRIENPGADYYQLTQIDSSLSPKLTADELKRIEEADNTTLADFLKGEKIESLPDSDI